MGTAEPMLERWLARTIQSYPSAAVPFLAGEADRFRNPVGHTLRQSLTILLQQLQGSMEAGHLGPALDAILRLRAVQELSASQAVGFVFLLKPIVRELAPECDQGLLSERIDVLALLAFDQYMRCREQLAEIRARESWHQLGRRPSLG
jgi:RsbT co-antagonist protein rsbRD N-terminal domain